MALIKYYPNPSEELYLPLLERIQSDDAAVRERVAAIMEDVKKRGDEALREYALKFDGSDLDELFVSEEEFAAAEAEVPEELKAAIKRAYGNILTFHKAELSTGEDVCTEPGVRCFRKIVPIKKVGLYIPGGTAPLFSTVLMLCVPAKVAGCGEITLATPAKNGKVNSAVLYTAALCGVKRVLKCGGAQAIAALAYGTASVGRVDKIFGPGNRYVAFAKSKASEVCSIDMVAGPSEVMVVCDSTADPLYVATDLLSQAEHGRDSQVMLVIRAADEAEASRINGAIEEKLFYEVEKLGRKEYMLPSLSHSAAFSFYDDESVLKMVNSYAPEHLIINTSDPYALLEGVESAGSVFLGPYSPESAGDYASGTNHTLPTSGHAASQSGVSVDSFIKKITVQELTKEGIRSLAPTVITMAEAEELTAHAEAARVRMA